MVCTIEATFLGTKRDAKDAGCKYYFNGNLCRHGHLSNKYTSSGDCVVCANEKHRRRYDAHYDEIRKYARDRIKMHGDRIRETVRLDRLRNPEKYRQWDRNRYQRDKEKRLPVALKWRIDNPEEAREAKYRWQARNPWAARRNRDNCQEQATGSIPQWLTDEQWEQIYAIYERARQITEETGIVHEVDHIHPLTSENFCGLHVPWNLQILTRSQNRKKANKLPDELTLTLNEAA